LLLISPTGASGQGDPEAATSSGTSTDLLLLATYVLLALTFSFLCSVAEAVLLSITPSYIEGQREKRPRHAALLKRLKQDNIDRSLAAILTLNTIAHTIGAILAGAQATKLFGSVWVGLFSALMTLLILFLSEIIPKTIGAIYWPRLASPTTLFVHALTIILYPIVWVSERLTHFISRGRKIHSLSRDEFLAMTRVGEQAGHIHDNESRIIHNLLRFESLKVKDIMTPRTVVSALPEEMTVQEALKRAAQNPFSRLPLYKGSVDNVTGFVLRSDILLKKLQGQDDDQLKSFKRAILAVPAAVPLAVLLEHLLKGRQHIAVVVDEYGGTSGLVTLEDLVETLMGVEIMDEIDKVEDMQILARKLWADRAQALGIDGIIAEEGSISRGAP